MDTIITLLTYLFDIFILYVYLTGVMPGRKKEVSNIFFLGGFVVTELALLGCELLTIRLDSSYTLYVNSAVSILSTFALCFFFQSTLRHKIFVSLMFQVLVLLSENILSTILDMINPEWLQSTAFREQILYLNLSSKCILFLLCLLFSTFYMLYFKKTSVEYQILNFTTPVVSLIILLSVPHAMIVNYTDFVFFFRFLFLCLILLNIINYILLEKTRVSMEFRNHYQQMEQQINFQKNKYQQLNIAYRETRRIVHDTKKHYFSIQKMIETQQYDKLLGYTGHIVEALEATYARVNTGNLVIDSFITNYWDTALSENIMFRSTIQIDPAQIPVNDYDLCVVLGNLLDNALQACRQNTGSENHIHVEILTTEQDSMTIHITNSFREKTEAPEKSSSHLYHGYGLENVRRIVESYHGLMRITKDGDFDVFAIIPIIREPHA